RPMRQPPGRWSWGCLRGCWARWAPMPGRRLPTSCAAPRASMAGRSRWWAATAEGACSSALRDDDHVELQALVVVEEAGVVRQRIVAQLGDHLRRGRGGVRDDHRTCRLLECDVDAQRWVRGRDVLKGPGGAVGGRLLARL